MQRINPKVSFSPSCYTKSISGVSACIAKAVWSWLCPPFLEPTIRVSPGSKGLPWLHLETYFGEQHFFAVISKGKPMDLTQQCTNGASFGHHEEIATA